jgi:hypothetical protein
LAQIIDHINIGGGHASQTQVFDALRSEIAVMKVREVFMPLLLRQNGQNEAVFGGDTPAERWEYFCRLNRKVVAEIMPVPVKDFLDKVPDPKPDELKSFYDQYKNDYPDPHSPTPGFKLPFKAQFQYVKADYDKLFKAEEVTDEEISDYYEKHKDQFRRSNLPDVPEMPGDAAKPGSDATPADDAKSDGAKTDDKATGDAGKGTGDAAKGPGDANATKGPAAEMSVPAPKTDEKKSDAKADVQSSDAKSPAKNGTDSKSDPKSKSGSDKKKADDGKQSSLHPQPQFDGSAPAENSLNGELLALANDDPAAAKADAKSDAKADTKGNSTKAGDSAKSTDTQKPDTQKPDTQKPDTQKPDTQKPDTQKPDTQKPDIQTPGGTPPIEYDPLEKASPTIRRQLANKRVEDKIKVAFAEVQIQLDRYSRALDNYSSEIAKGNTKAKKPEPPQLVVPADLELKETEMISIPQAANDTDLGHSRSLVMSGEYTTQSFVQIAFQPTLKPYVARHTDDTDNNQYLWWKTGDQAGRVPPLEEIKTDVTNAWKLIQARTPAKAQAEKDAALAKKEQQSLKDTFKSDTDDKVTKVGPFSWLSRQASNPMAVPLVTPVDDIDLTVPDLAPEFMKIVFALKNGETGVAPNAPVTIYYVVQIENDEPTLNELHEQFMFQMGNEMTSMTYAQIAAVENVDAVPLWVKELENQFGVQMAPGHTLSNARGKMDEED